MGPGYGYFPNASKTWILVKHSHLSHAQSVFADTHVNLTCDGRPHLGAPLGTQDYVDRYMKDKVNTWCTELELLSTIAKTQPHAAYAAFTHGLTSKWTFLTRTVPNIGPLLLPLEKVIRSSFIPSFTNGLPPNDQLRDLLSLPARLGGIGLSNPVTMADFEFAASQRVTDPLKNLVLQQKNTYSYEAVADQISAISEIHQMRRNQASQAAEDLQPTLPPDLQRAMTLAKEKGASSWLTTLPIKEFDFCLHKGAFSDALALRYGWPLSRTPSHCACGKFFSVEHALSCPRGGFPIIRHNELRDLTASLLTEVCHDVRTEPDLQPLSGERMTTQSANTTDGARLDITVNGFWGGRFEKTYIDVRVFNPLAPSHRNLSITQCFRKHEQEKRRAYDERIRLIEHASFTPLVFSATGGIAKQGETFYKRLASLLAVKWDQEYGKTLSWLRCKLCFCLLRSAIQCIRGARSSRGRPNSSRPDSSFPIDLVIEESRVEH